MNLPNKLTTLRVVLAFFFMVSLLVDFPFSKCLALFFFSLASFTDMYDGVLARKMKLESDYGKLLDPVADKILVSIAFISFIAMPTTHLAAWIVIIIISRELVVTGLRMLALSKGEVLAADTLGKTKTIFQFSVIILILILLTIREFLSLYSEYWSIAGPVIDMRIAQAAFWLTFFVMLVTVYSGIVYLYDNRKTYLSSM
ncbi:MAG: CDP-diacylglycerol--glycerol-3-phosphate 3-phosphatidyltransferase [Candidatus Ancaeobacter aquaticus]|nr:CDP-diacylglycerol--glycerol-3-phosphate 3-phosphatidyltransferase [Candidatus Ancaeobacter aquaticus]